MNFFALCCVDLPWQVHNEAELKRILPIAKRHGVPVTFRAAGTSLSGQALTDSVLLKLSHTGKNFRNYTIHVSLRCFDTASKGLCCEP
jgi:FAD/FMN-containing dehydrogenase